MNAFIPVIVYFFFLFIIGRAFIAGITRGKKSPIDRDAVAKTLTKNIKKESASPARTMSRSPKAEAHTHSSPRLYKTVTLKKPGAVKAEEQISRFMEDRQNDWLAKQIREEQRILTQATGLDIGASHAKVCAADLLKRVHEDECDADGNDLGEYL